MNWIAVFLIGAVAAVALFVGMDYLVKAGRTPKSVESYLWNAAYFLQLKQYQKVLERLNELERDFALTPEEMSDASFKRADAYRGLNQPEKALEAYERVYECLLQFEEPLKRKQDLLNEIKACYVQCGREPDFAKWEALFPIKNDLE